MITLKPLLAGLFLVSMCLPSSAQQAVIPPASPSAGEAAAGALDLAHSVMLHVRFQGYPELTGEYRINTDQTVSIPVLGRLPVNGLSAADLEKQLTRRATDIAQRPISVTVETALYKPVYATGLVEKPGAVVWTPDLTVLQVVALAGGIYRRGSAGDATTRTSNDQVRVAKLVDEQKRNLATLARLRAEAAGAQTITPPTDLVRLVGREPANALIAGQARLMADRRNALAAHIASLERGQKLADSEVAGLKAQGERVAEQLKLRRETSEKLQGLHARGIVTATKSIDEQIKVSELEEKAVNVAVGSARVRSVAASLERDKIQIEQDRQVAIAAEIMAVERQIAQNAIELEAAEQAGFETNVGESAVSKVVYTLVQQRAGKQVERPVTASEKLAPGDVLVVAREPI